MLNLLPYRLPIVPYYKPYYISTHGHNPWMNPDSHFVIILTLHHLAPPPSLPHSLFPQYCDCVWSDVLCGTLLRDYFSPHTTTMNHPFSGFMASNHHTTHYVSSKHSLPYNCFSSYHPQNDSYWHSNLRLSHDCTSVSIIPPNHVYSINSAPNHDF